MPESSIPPVPAKGSSSGAMIGGSVAMLLIIAGLLYWKLGASEPEPQAEAPPPAKVKEVKKPAFEAPPPPPPPEEEVVEEEKEEEKKPVKAKGPRGPSGCSGECNGTVTPALQSALRSKAGQARGCYERALRQNSMLQGRMTVQVKVSASGGLCSANVTSNTIGDPAVTSCVAQKFRAGGYAKPQGGCVVAAVPINFMPKQ